MSDTVSVVVPTLRDADDLPVAAALDRCSFDDYELLVCDDEPVTRARNEGARRAASEKIVYLDDDSRPRDGYLAGADRLLADHDAFAGQLTNHYDFGERPRTVRRFWGCNMGLRREVLAAAGWWDERMGWGHEEKELADRVVRDHEIRYDPDIVVDHEYAASLPDYWRKRYRLEQATPYYLRKRGATTADVLRRVVVDLCSPTSYLGQTPSLTLARTGGTLAGTAGRLVGLFD